MIDSRYQRHACWFWVVSHLSEPRCFSLSYFITVLFACKVGCLVFFRLPEGSPLVSQTQNLATAQYLVTNYFFLIGLLSPAQLSSTSGIIGMEFVGLFLKLQVSKLWLRSGCISPPVCCAEIGSEHAEESHLEKRDRRSSHMVVCSCHFYCFIFIFLNMSIYIVKRDF